MKVLWTIVKVVFALVFVVPVAIIVLAMAVGIFGALVGLAILALKFAVIAFLAYLVLRFLGRLVFGESKPAAPAPQVRSLPPVDPYYEAAMRELDRDVGK